MKGWKISTILLAVIVVCLALYGWSRIDMLTSRVDALGSRGAGLSRQVEGLEHEIAMSRDGKIYLHVQIQELEAQIHSLEDLEGLERLILRDREDGLKGRIAWLTEAVKKLYRQQQALEAKIRW